MTLIINAQDAIEIDSEEEGYITLIADNSVNGPQVIRVTLANVDVLCQAIKAEANSVKEDMNTKGPKVSRPPPPANINKQ